MTPPALSALLALCDEVVAARVNAANERAVGSTCRLIRAEDALYHACSPEVVAALVRVAMEADNAMDYGTVREFSDLAKALRALDAARDKGER